MSPVLRKGGHSPQSMMKKKRLFFYFFLFLALPAFAQEGKGERTFSFYFENDAFLGSDKEYTNGVRFSYAAPHIPFASRAFTEKVNRFIDEIPIIGSGDAERLFVFSFGQGIYTPDNTEAREYLPDERPYAGLTYLGLSLVKRKALSISNWELAVGMVGKSSLASETQRAVHKLGEWDYPKGWDNQLKDEPILQLFYDKKWLFPSKETERGFGVDFIPKIGWGIGNAFIYTGAGVQLRFGWNLPNDFGTGHIGPSSESRLPANTRDPRFDPATGKIGIHGFIGANGGLIGRNILLDGNTFRDSASVSKEKLVGDVIYGIGIAYKRVTILYLQTHRSHEYKTQKEGQDFGTLHFSYTW